MGGEGGGGKWEVGVSLRLDFCFGESKALVGNYTLLSGDDVRSTTFLKIFLFT